jgi:biotin operon repressor
VTRPNGQHEWTAEQDEKLLRMTAEKMPVSARARTLGLSEAQVRSRLTRLRSEIPVYVDEPQAVDKSEVPATALQNLPDRVEMLVKLTKRGVSLEELCDRMDLAPKAVRELVDDARKRGFVVDIDGPHVGHRPASPRADAVPVVISQAGDARIFAQITDLHYGSRYCLEDQIDDFVNIAYARGVRLIAITGDAIEGMYRHARWELTHHGWQDQSARFAQRLPQKPGLIYRAITGNHDETFEKEAGLDVCHAMVEVFRAHGRTDLEMIGARGGRMRLLGAGDKHGAEVELWHPLGGGSYAISYKLQKHVESYAPGAKPDFLFCGHFHMSGAIHTRGVHAYHGGTFQGGGGPFGKALGSSPAIGGWIVSYRQTSEGTLRDVTSSWISYYEHEQPREVALGAP